MGGLTALDFAALNNRIPLPDAAAAQDAKARWDSIAKPLGSLGLLEDDIIRIAALTGSAAVRLEKRAVLVFCADNGVVAEGVTQTGAAITALVAGNMSRGVSSVCRMAKLARADVLPLDVGMLKPEPGVRDLHIARGTGNIAAGPAMTPTQCERAIQTGIDVVRECAQEGYSLLALGEMGIGNTTTSSAVAAVLLRRPVAEMTGRGAGLSDSGLARKRDAIERAVAVNQPDPADAFDVLQKLGGFDIAAMAGAYIGGALCRVPVLIDGFIGAVAALGAVRLCPACAGALLASHVSAEPAAHLVLKELGLFPLITAGLRLGEGTGAVAAMPLLDMALAVYDEMSTFGGIGMERYTPQGGQTP